MELAEVQRLMDELYGEADRARGVPSTVAWLAEELGELAQAVRKGTREQQVHEFGDVLAWSHHSPTRWTSTSTTPCSATSRTRPERHRITVPRLSYRDDRPLQRNERAAGMFTRGADH